MANHAALIRADNDGLSVARRGRRFIEFALPDGKRRHVATIDPLHKRDGETEIDATWYPDTGAWQWKIGENDWQAHARAVFNVGSLIEWRHASGEWVVVDPQSINWINQDNSRQQIAIKQAVTGTASDATLTFTNAYGSGRHFEYIAHPKRLIKHFILDQALPVPESWLTGTIWFEVEWTITNSSGVELYLDGVKWARKNKVKTQTANAIEFRSRATGEVLWYADAPHAADANGETVAAQYQVENQAGSYFIRVRVPREWLLAAVYPVVVDPTFTDGYGGDATTYCDTYLYIDGADTNYGTNTIIVTYAGSTVLNSLLLFDLDSLPAGATIDTATLSIFCAVNDYETGTLTARRILAANSAWTEADATWNYAVTSTTRWAGDTGSNGGTDAGCSVSGTDYSATALGSSAIGAFAPATGEANDIELDTTEFAALWAANYGIVLFGGPYRQWGSSDHATTGYRPKLVVEYTEAGGDVLQLATVAWASVGQFAGVANASIAQVIGVVAN